MLTKFPIRTMAAVLALSTVATACSASPAQEEALLIEGGAAVLGFAVSEGLSLAALPAPAAVLVIEVHGVEDRRDFNGVVLDANDRLLRGRGADEIRGGRGADYLTGGGGHDSIYGGKGADVLYGKAGADALYGRAGIDTLYGGSGDDSLWGGSGPDTLYGKKGDDHLFGRSGDDTLIGGAGTDVANGGSGFDDCAAETVTRCET